MEKKDLDKRICDVEPNETCTMTYREYINWGYTELGYPKKTVEQMLDLDKMSEDMLNDVLEEVDWLLSK